MGIDRVHPDLDLNFINNVINPDKSPLCGSSSFGIWVPRDPFAHMSKCTTGNQLDCTNSWMQQEWDLGRVPL